MVSLLEDEARLLKSLCVLWVGAVEVCTVLDRCSLLYLAFRRTIHVRCVVLRATILVQSNRAWICSVVVWVVSIFPTSSDVGLMAVITPW